MVVSLAKNANMAVKDQGEPALGGIYGMEETNQIYI